MGRCVRCGMPMPGDVSGAVCLNCQREEQRKSALESQKKAAAKRNIMMSSAIIFFILSDPFCTKAKYNVTL